MTFDIVYRVALAHVINKGFEQLNKRTGSKVLSTHGYSFVWDMNIWPVTYCRPMYARTIAAEVAWMLSGEKSIAWISQYTTIWNDFANEHGLIDTAYGFRWAYTFGHNQIHTIIKNLKADPTSRQQVLMSWDAHTDNTVPAKNVPCPYTAVFNIINNKLNCHLTLRSNDVWLGLPYDVGMYTLLSNALAASLNVDVGELFYSIAHMHLYENQLEASSAVITAHEYGMRHKIELQSWSIEKILANRDTYVQSAVQALKDTGYSPSIGPAKVKVVL